MLPTVDFCGLPATRLIIGANPFGGYSHQNPERDKVMREYYTTERILETWARAEAAGINTMITNNETPHVLAATKAYLQGGGELQWIAQVNGTAMLKGGETNMIEAIDEVVEIGCSALYIHGGVVDYIWHNREEDKLSMWLDHARSLGVPAGVAGHDPRVHLWIYELGLADFHTVCFFNCGSLHAAGGGERFELVDPPKAVAAIQKIEKPCIGYKIMGSGRIDAKMAFQYAFEQIKPTDVVNVGMHRGDKDGMVEENVALAEEILAA